MRVLVVALEFFPILKVGGIADALAALTSELVVLGHDVTVVLPRVSGAPSEVRLASGVRVLCLDVPGFSLEDLYGDDFSESPDAALRHGYFAHAVMQELLTAARSKEPYDVVSVHDWPAAVVPFLVRRAHRELPTLRSVLTIHNVGFQGVFPSEAIRHFGLPPFEAERGPLAHVTPGRINLLKAGVECADAVTTVSPTHALELVAHGGAAGLETTLARRSRAVVGILNGIDMRVWNPATDGALVRPFDANALVAKRANKDALRAELGIPESAARPLVAHVGRIFHEKGSDLLAAAIAGIAALGADIVVAGTGDPSIMKALHDRAWDAGATVRVLGFVPEDLVHRILAAADIVVVPSRIEPCGLVQMYAQRYGALPVARRTGGLTDTIVDFDHVPGEGTGFLFDEASSSALLGAVGRALGRFDGPSWPGLQKRAMGLDRSWARSATAYDRLFRELTPHTRESM